MADHQPAAILDEKERDAGSKRRVSLRNRLETVFRANKETRFFDGIAEAFSKHQKRSSPTLNKLPSSGEYKDNLLLRPLAIAFEKAGLDMNKQDDWTKIVFLFSWACFLKPRGRTKVLFAPELLRVVRRVEEIRAKEPNLTEQQCCMRLAKEELKGKGGAGVKARAGRLRRLLQDGKKIDSPINIARVFNAHIRKRTRHSRI